MADFLKDFEPESFVLDKYVEKLTQQDPNTGLGPIKKKEGMPFDPKVLLKSFQASLGDLQDLSEKVNTKVEKCEFLCAKQEREHAMRVRQLEPLFQDAFNEFQELEDRITYVARKVVHLGDQLEASNSHRSRDAEAERLMEIMMEFKLKSKSSQPEFTDPTKLTEGADLINKLNLLANELPLTEDYSSLRKNIADKYVDIENQLVGKFFEALQASDVKRMRLYASTLQQFQHGSAQCMNNYIGHHIHNMVQSNPASSDDIFKTLETRCAKVYKQMSEVFDNPEEAMTKFLQQVIDKVLYGHVNKELEDAGDIDKEDYLQKLYHLHIRAMILRDSLTKLETKIDPSFLTKTIRYSLFGDHLAAYTEFEVGHLIHKCHMTLADFYSSVGIQKKQGGVIRATIPQNLAGNSPEELFVSENVCTSVLFESRNSIKRCKELLMDRELSHALREIFDTILDNLCADHFTTALELAAEYKGGPTGVFLQVVGCVNKNIHLIEKLFREIIMPLIQYAPIAAHCNERKREMLLKLESRIETGMERSVSSMVATLHSILNNQKKTDYRPEEPIIPETSQCCTKAVSHIASCAQVIKLSLDGKNQEVVLLEFGIRVHRELYEHILSFTINSIGAMFLICDVNEYRKVMKEFKSPFLDEVFENLQTLCNLFIVMHENLKQVCSEEPYVSFDRNVITRIVNSRADYKTAKLAKLFNQ